MSEITVRAIDAPDEYEAFFRLAAGTFARGLPLDAAAADWHRWVVESPSFQPGAVRGAFEGTTLVGGYLVDERLLRIGPARVRSGWIGGVVTHPDHRRRGIGSALMRDALACASARGQAVLLLNGARHFYDPFGYIDIFDATVHRVERAAILAQPPSPYSVRPATPADAPALLSLYERHYGPYSGSVARTPDEQAHALRFAASVGQGVYRTAEGLPYGPPLLAVGPDGGARGYLAFPWGPLSAFGCEAAADNWPVALALLQHHARQCERLESPPDELEWPLPPDSIAAQALADHLPLRSLSRPLPHAGWMASPVDLLLLVDALRTVWQERRRQGTLNRSDVLDLTIDDITWTIDLELSGEGRAEVRTEAMRAPGLSASQFVQLLFGYRSGGWLAAQPGWQGSSEDAALLDALFPSGRPWIAPTDGC